REHALGAGTLEWLPGFGDDVVAFRNGSVVVVANAGAAAVSLPAGDVLLASGPLGVRELPADAAVWLRA
ncbi:MAG: alpha-amylase, partial [Agromyces sp.]|nr:alpha-amylase [Agromyces sp.]